MSDMKRWSRRNRRGAMLVEGAVVLVVCLMIVLAALDLGLAVLQYNMLSAGSRRVARVAIVRGENAPPEFAAWGPLTHTGTADDLSEMSEALQPVLVAVDPADVNLQVEWIDGGNAVDQRVRVTVSTDYQPIITSVLGTSKVGIQSTSTMRIVH